MKAVLGIMLGFIFMTILGAPSCFTHRGYFALHIINRTGHEITAGNIFFECEGQPLLNFSFAKTIKPGDKYELLLPNSKDSVLRFISEHVSCHRANARFSFTENDVKVIKEIPVRKFNKEGPLRIICR